MLSIWCGRALDPKFSQGKIEQAAFLQCFGHLLFSAVRYNILSPFNRWRLTLAVLKSLTFTNVPIRRHDPVAARRDKLAERLQEQKKLLANPSHVRTVQRWTGKGDERKQIEK